MDRFYLQWNIVNWITVVLMAAVGMMIMGSIIATVKAYNGAANA